MNRYRASGLLIFLVLALLVGVNFPSASADTPAIKEFEAFDIPCASNADICTTSLTPSTRGGISDASHPNVAYRMSVGITPGSSDSIVELRITSGSVSFDFDFNNGTALTAGRLYTFTFAGSSTYAYNLQCETETRATWLVERVEDGGL